MEDGEFFSCIDKSFGGVRLRALDFLIYENFSVI